MVEKGLNFQLTCMWYMRLPLIATCLTSFELIALALVDIVALGLTKAMHEFLTLHYFAIDSAAGWDELLERIASCHLDESRRKETDGYRDV